SLIGEIIGEDDPSDKIDDVIFFVLGVVAITWYKKMGYKAGKTTGSIILLVLGILTKILAISIEYADKEAVGDDFGIISGLIIALVFVIWQTLSHKKELV